MIARRGDDRGVAMFFVVAATVTVASLLVGLLGVLVAELVPTAYERKSQRSVAAAQAGLQVGLAAVRAAYGSTSGSTHLGDPSRLPCYPASAPLTGRIDGLDADQEAYTYAVTITYYTVNPAGQGAAWRARNVIGCTAGSGAASAPTYALVESRATAAVALVPGTWGDRSLELVYLLNRTDQAVLGGAVHPGGTNGPLQRGLCWAASGYPAAVGTTVQLADCVPGDPAQNWSYRSDYSLVLTATQAATSPPSGGLCITTSTDGAGGITGASLQTCSSGTWNQLWGYDDNGEFQGVRPDSSSMSGQCLRTDGSPVSGALLTMGGCDGYADVTPDAAVGAGAAGPGSQQLVNYLEFGRCLDITGYNLDTTYLIDYPCKQDPTSTVGWNQRWIWDRAGTRQLITNTDGGPYCLTSPGNAGGWVVVRPCDGTRTDQTWTLLGDTGNRSTSYTVTDAQGRCLSLQTTDTPWVYSVPTVDACDGSFAQKWNAPPLPEGANVVAERETTNGR